MKARVPLRCAWLAAGTAILIAGCGGGSGDGGGNPAPLNIVVTELDDGVVGMPYDQTVVATGGTGQKTYSLSGTLPDGLGFDDGDGSISGTPTGPAGEADITVTVTDSDSPANTDSQDLTLRIAAPLVADTGDPPMATVGVAYIHNVAVSGGIPPYLVSAELPSGLSIDAEGVISGTPASDARTTDGGGLAVFDSAMPPQEISIPLRIPVELEVTTTALPDAIGGVSYSAQLQAQGGLPDFEWDMTGGTLPFLFRSSGLVDGTPDASCSIASFAFDVSVTDSDTPAQAATRAGITLDVVPRAVSFPDSTAPPVASLGVAYSYPIGLIAGVAPYAFAVITGALPPGLSLNAASGVLSGTPTTEGTYEFTVRVTDDCGETDTMELVIIVRDAPTGRNDSTATATPLGNGSIVASISPSGHPNSTFSPDEDYYVVQTTGTSTITVDLTGIGGGIDTVVELVNAGGARLQSCAAPLFDDECMNDDRVSGNLDSLLEVRVTGATTFYVHVVEWRGDARPDLRYRLELSGIN